MLVTSRSGTEYQAMFGLSTDDLAGRTVLDCCAGGSSFTAEIGAGALAVDPAYGLSAEDLAASVHSALGDGDAIIDEHADRFDWSWYGTPARRRELRRNAAVRFLIDRRENPTRYVAAALPSLPIASGCYDLVLCSHLLFTWADHFDEDWHRRAIRELVRVAKQQVRVFPLITQGAGLPVPYLPTLRDELHGAGHRTSLREVPYRFQRGENQMMVIDVIAHREQPESPTFSVTA